MKLGSIQIFFAFSVLINFLKKIFRGFTASSSLKIKEKWTDFLNIKRGSNKGHCALFSRGTCAQQPEHEMSQNHLANGFFTGFSKSALALAAALSIVNQQYRCTHSPASLVIYLLFLYSERDAFETKDTVSHCVFAAAWWKSFANSKQSGYAFQRVFLPLFFNLEKLVQGRSHVWNENRN